MASPAIIGALRVVLGADTAALDKGLRDAQSRMAAFGASMAKAGTAIAASMAAATTAIAVAVKNAIDEADKIGKASQKIGIPVEQLSELKYAADLSDVSIETLSSSMGRLAKNMSEAAGSATGLAARAFTALNISVKNSDGSLRSSADVMADVADRFSRMNDGANKTALAMAIFGRAGAEMIPMLNAGKIGLADAAEEARKLGIVLSTQTTDAAQQVNDNLTRMRRAFDGMVIQISTAMLPTLERMSDGMVEIAKNGDLMKGAADGIVAALKFVINTAITAGFVFDRLGKEMSAFWAFLVAPNWAEAKARWAEFNAVGKETEERFRRLGESIDQFWSGVQSAGAAASGASAGFWQQQADAISSMNKQVIDAIKNFKDLGDGPRIASSEDVSRAKALQDRINGLILQTRELRGDFAQFAPGFVQAVAGMKNVGDAASATFANLAPKMRELNQRMMEFRGAQLTHEVMAPWQAYEEELKRIKQLLDANVISQETFERAVRRTAENAQATWGQAGESIAGSFKTIAESFGKESSDMARMAKIFGIVQGTISMFTGAAKALELPFPANIAAMASVLAKGAALVASIRSQTVPGFKTGGSFEVGGFGGTDSQRVAFDATPGEMVNITKGNDAGPSGGKMQATFQFVGPIGDKELLAKMQAIVSATQGRFAEGMHRDLFAMLTQQRALQG